MAIDARFVRAYANRADLSVRLAFDQDLGQHGARVVDATSGHERDRAVDPRAELPRQVAHHRRLARVGREMSLRLREGALREPHLAEDVRA